MFDLRKKEEEEKKVRERKIERQRETEDLISI